MRNRNVCIIMIVSLALFLCGLFSCFLVATFTGLKYGYIVLPKATEAQTTETAPAVIEPAPVVPAPTVEVTPTLAPTPTEVPFTGLVIKDCPTESLGIHPDSGKPLEFQMYPYVNKDGTGDTNVLCIYEVLNVEEDVKIELSGNNVAINADFSHGTYNDDGTLKDACPTGWECEGVWVATDDFIIPAGTLTNLHVYIREQPAKQRFTETISWQVPTPGEMAPFACEYVATQGHSMWNIRVPAWAQAQGEVGTIYGFGLPVGNQNRLTCEGFPIDWEPLPGQLTTK